MFKEVVQISLNNPKYESYFAADKTIYKLVCETDADISGVKYQVPLSVSARYN
jgi:hypothetical protein